MGHLVDNLIEAARRHPDRPAVRLEDLVLTYRELLDAARRTAGMLDAGTSSPSGNSLERRSHAIIRSPIRSA